MKNRKKFLVTLLSAVLLAGGIAVPAEAANNDYKISRVGEKSKTVYVGKELEVEVKKLGSKKVKGSQIKWKRYHWAVTNGIFLFISILQ